MTATRVFGRCTSAVKLVVAALLTAALFGHLMAAGASPMLHPGAPTPGSVPIPPLPAGQKPNIIFILIDDLGFDDFGFANPKYLTTPNMDKFLLEGTRFDNFFVASQCAQTRSMLLTGRHHARVGTMMVNGGWDFIHPDETSIAEVMAAGGYTTAQIGKWHNAGTLGYTPIDMGFNMSSHIIKPGYDPNEEISKRARIKLMSINNQYNFQKSDDSYHVKWTLTLNNEAIKYLQGQEAKQKKAASAGKDPEPFFLYYPLNAVHTPRKYPERYRLKFFGPRRDPKYNGISANTLDSWAFVEYLDEAMGQLLDYLNASSLRSNTIIMFGSDNGPDEPWTSDAAVFPVRLPTGMVGCKSHVYEGGIRTMFGVQGPGVQSGVIDSTLLQITDVMPTLAELAGVDIGKVAALPLDGITFKHLLTPAAKAKPAAETASDRFGQLAAATSTDGGAIRREDKLASKEQQDRFVFTIKKKEACWDPDVVPSLTPDREVDKTQSILSYDKGANRNRLRRSSRAAVKGYQQCIVVHHQGYKWHGRTNKVYRFVGSDHREIPDNEVTGSAADRLAAMFQEKARAWWTSVLDEDHSFTRAIFLLGKSPYRTSSITTTAPLERTHGNIHVNQMSVAGFRQPGDRVCYKAKVLTAGVYEVFVIYRSQQAAKFKLSVGTFGFIRSGQAPSIVTVLPEQNPELKGYTIGNITLSTSGQTKTELCLELLTLTNPGSAVFSALANIRFELKVNRTKAASLESNQTTLHSEAQISNPGDSTTGTLSQRLDSGSAESGFESLANDPAAESASMQDAEAMPSAADTAAPAASSTFPVAQPGPNPDLGSASGWLLSQVADGMSGETTQTNSQDPAAEPLMQQRQLNREKVERSWHQLRLMFGWPDGQGNAFEFMYSPFDTEDCSDCEGLKI